MGGHILWRFWLEVIRLNEGIFEQALFDWWDIWVKTGID